MKNIVRWVMAFSTWGESRWSPPGATHNFCKVNSQRKNWGGVRHNAESRTTAGGRCKGQCVWPPGGRRAGDGLMTDAGRNENCSGFSDWGDGHTLGSDAVLLADKVLSWSSELLSRRSGVGGVALRFKEHVTTECIVSQRVPSQGWLKPSYYSAGPQPH